MAGALEHIKILDLSRYAPGPYCTMILGDLGADIIKVEGVRLRSGLVAGSQAKDNDNSSFVVREFVSPYSPYDPLNRNKRSIALNLKSEQGRLIFYKMAESADIVLEGFKPGVAGRLGVDYPKLKEINSRIIYCAITGYGQNGPYHNLPGHDINYIAQGGAVGIMRNPALPGNLIGDIASGGMQAAIGILAALAARERTGEGQFVDISMTDGVVSMLAPYLGQYLENRTFPDEMDKVSMGVTHFYNFYETKDNRFIAIGCSEPPFFANLCKALECEEFIPFQTDPGKAREIKDFLSKKFLSRTRDEWFEYLSHSDIAVSKVNRLDELSEDPQLRHRNMIVELDHPELGKVTQAGISIKLSATPGSIRKFSPRPGEDTESILSELGYGKDDINRLAGEGIISLGD